MLDIGVWVMCTISWTMLIWGMVHIHAWGKGACMSEKAAMIVRRAMYVHCLRCTIVKYRELADG